MTVNRTAVTTAAPTDALLEVIDCSGQVYLLDPRFPTVLLRQEVGDDWHEWRDDWGRYFCVMASGERMALVEASHAVLATEWRLVVVGERGPRPYRTSRVVSVSTLAPTVPDGLTVTDEPLTPWQDLASPLTAVVRCEGETLIVELSEGTRPLWGTVTRYADRGGRARSCDGEALVLVPGGWLPVSVTPGKRWSYAIDGTDREVRRRSGPVLSISLIGGL